jgi:hypothetical protein
LKINSLMERLVTVQMREWERIEAGGQPIGRRYLPPVERKVRLIYNAFGIPTLYTNEELQKTTFLSHFTDQAGVELLPDTTLYVIRRKAVLNVFGFSDGFAYQLGEIKGDEVSWSFEDEPLEIITDNVNNQGDF